MDIYKINYNQIRQNPDIAKMLEALERGFSKYDIDFYLVGAVARDVWMSVNKLEARRTTADIDFAVLINNKDKYSELKNYLIENEDFNPYTENGFVLIWKDKTQVDLLPFGAIEDESGNVKIEGSGFTSVNMPGFKEIYAEGLPELQFEDGHRFKFCTLPGIVILKLIAWDDRPEMRTSDIMDISDILNHFFEMYSNEIYENHNDLFTGEELELIQIAAIVLGRQMKKVAQRNQKLYNRLYQILNSNTLDLNSPISKIMIDYFKNSIDYNVILLKYLLQGFKT